MKGNAMSHFCVYVITDHEPTHDELGAILQPYHEFECTGEDDQYVQDVDQLEEILAEYESATVPYVRKQDGALVKKYADEFYRDPTNEEQTRIGKSFGTGFGNGISWTSKDWGDGRGYRSKVHHIPDGCVQLDVAVPTIMTFRAYLEDDGWEERRTGSDRGKYRWFEVDSADKVTRVVKRTNTNSKWDWWQAGGRWNGLLCGRSSIRRGDIVDVGEVVAPFAVLSDGKWVERGTMGWWACVKDEKPQGEWDDMFRKILSELQPDRYITVVDCHI